MVDVKMIGYIGKVSCIDNPEHLYPVLEISGDIEELVELLKLVSETLHDKPHDLEMNLYIMPSSSFFLKTVVNAKTLADIVKAGLSSEKAEVRELALEIYNVVAKIFPEAFKLTEGD